MSETPTPPPALLITQDLFFSSKISGTAASLGFRVDIVGGLEQVRARIAENDYRCLLLDLTTPGLAVAELMAALPAEHQLAVIAFGPHVNTARLQEARDAGCDEVLPRSKFSATLPELLNRHLG